MLNYVKFFLKKVQAEKPVNLLTYPVDVTKGAVLFLISVLRPFYQKQAQNAYPSETFPHA
jgi:hypothetical protein